MLQQPVPEPLERSVRQLSGGERRRVALALGLGFLDLAAQRGNFRCNLLVLDEVHHSYTCTLHHKYSHL